MRPHSVSLWDVLGTGLGPALSDAGALVPALDGPAPVAVSFAGAAVRPAVGLVVDEGELPLGPHAATATISGRDRRRRSGVCIVAV